MPHIKKIEHLLWIRDRLVMVKGDDPDVDFIWALERDIILPMIRDANLEDPSRLMSWLNKHGKDLTL